MERTFKRVLSLLVAVVMVLSMVPANVFATETAATGSATQTDLTISTADELKAFADEVNGGNSFEGKKVVLANDIDLEYTAVVIGTKANPFKGTFDGQNHTVSNLYVTEYGADNDYFADSNDNLGLFGVINTPAVIKNVTVHNPYLVGSAYVGGIVGMAYTGKIENCHVTGEIDIEGFYMVGGITGHGYAKIYNCSVVGAEGWDYNYIGATYKVSDLEGDNVGGIVGHAAEDNNIEGCTVKNVTVSGTRKVGGIVGITAQSTDLVNCAVSNVIVETTASADYAAGKQTTMSIGGIVGQYMADGNGVGGKLRGCSVNGLTFANENGVEVNAGALTGGVRAASGTTFEPAAKNVANIGNTVANVTGATVDYMEIPNATVSVQKPIVLSEVEHNYMCWPNGDKTIDRPLQIVMNFKANETLEQAEAGKYGKYICDFYLKLEGLANGSIETDGCYLAGNYGSFGWIVIPADDLVLDEGISYPIVSAYDANLTYEDICGSVKDFTAAIYISKEILAANPNFQVTLELRMTNHENSDEVLVIGTPYTYTAAELQASNEYFADYAEVKTEQQKNIDKVNTNTAIDVDANAATIETAKQALKNQNSALSDEAISAAVPKVMVTFITMDFEATAPKKVVYDVSPIIQVGSNKVKIESFDAPVTFRLPISSAETFEKAKVYHEDELMGVYSVQVEDGVKFIEVSSKNFSTFTVEPTDGKVAEVGGVKYETLQAAINAAQAGDTVTLLADVAIDQTVNIQKNIILDGNGHTINQAATFSGVSAFMIGDSSVGVTDLTVTVKDATFTGFSNSHGVLRIQGAKKVDVIGCTFTGNNQTLGGFGIISYNYAGGEVNGCTFEANNCQQVIDMNSQPASTYVAAATETLVVDGCEFTDNTCASTAVIYYVKGNGSQIKNNTFTGNTVDTTSHGAIVYYSEGANCSVTGNTFSGNTIEADGARAGLLILEDGINVTGNVFGNNTVTSNANGTTYVATVVNKADAETSGVTISGNYWNGGEPNYVSQKGAPTKVDNYYITYENGTLGGEVSTVVYVAEIGTVKYETLQAAINAVKEGETITVLAGTISEGTIKLPATLKNVTFQGEAGATLKDMTIMAADGNSFSYVGLTFDGLTFDNGRLLFTGWRNGEETIQDLTITNCTFKNLYDTTNTAPIHINKDASEAVKNFTFTNNVIDGATGGSKSGVYAQLTGEVVFTNNVINNVSFRPYVIQLTTDDGVADKFTVTGNTFSGSAVGRAQGLGNNAEGTDTVELVVSENIFKGITGSQQICYWNFNAEKTTADLSKNYYDIDIVANPDKIYFNSAAQDVEDLIEKGVYPYYTELNADGTINVGSKVDAPVIAKVELNGVPYATLEDAIADAKSGETITLLKDVTLAEELTLPAGIIFNGNGKQINGSIVAGGDLTFEGHTKVTSFSASYYNRTITIGVGACLEITGTGRVTLGYGNTFNITGSIENAKAAALSRTEIKPSLIIPGGMSITGGNDATMNITNAYVQIGSTSTKNSVANGEFTINITNSIAEFTSQLTFSEPTSGKNPTINMSVKDSVLTTATKLINAVPNSEIVIDNSVVTLGTYLRNSGEMILKNGSALTGSMIQFGENGGNDGTITVDASTLTLNITSAGHAMDGKGTGVVNVVNGATASIGYITNSDINVDTESALEIGNQILGDSSVTVDASNYDGTSALNIKLGAQTDVEAVEVKLTGSSSMTTKVENGEVTLVEKTLSGIGTATEPYQIGSLEDLILFRDKVNAGESYQGKYIVLTADIDLSSVENWTPIGTATNPFCGMFDGGNKTISNLVINGDKTYVKGGNNDNYKGLFGYMMGGNTAGIKNLTIQNAQVTGCLYVGVVLGRSYTGGIIENCHVKGSIQVDSYAYAGGIVGRHEYSADANGVAIKNCSVDGATLTRSTSAVNADYAVSYVGGIVGFMAEGKYIIQDCSAKNIQISGVYGVGGISGIGHYGNEITNAAVESVSVVSTGNDKEDDRTNNIGLIVGATQGTTSEPTVIIDATVTNTTATVTYTDNTNKEVTALYGTNIDGTTPVTNYVAEVNGKQYTSLQAAIDAAQNGEKVTLLADVALTKTLHIPAGKTLVLDGNGHKITPAAGFAADGHNAALAVAANDAAYNASNNYTIKNLTFEGFSGLTRVVRANFSDVVLENCAFNNNTVTEGVITSDYANLSVKDCKFNQNTSGFAILNIGFNVSTATNVVTNVTGSSFVGNKAAIAVAYLASSANVTGNAFKNNEHTGNNENAAAILAGPYAGGGNYTINITGNAFVNAMIGKPAVFAEDWAANYGVTTKFDLSSNYWDGAKPEEGVAYKTSGANPNLKLLNYYTSIDENGTLSQLVKAGLQGTGTATDPYLITSLEDLIFFRDSVNAGNNYSGKYIKVTATEIDLANEEWEPIGYMGKNFVGNFDGNGVIIKNLKITKAFENTAANNGIGFFGRTDDPAVIKNFTIENVDITGSLYVGAVVGYGYTGKMVQNVTVEGNIAIDAWWYAGVIGGNGYMNLINNCHVIGNDGSYIKGNNGSYIGGIWGFRGEGDNKITNCTVTGLEITGVDRVGGISGIGHYGNTISGCEAEAVTVTATDPNATTIGLIVGATQGTASEPTKFVGNTTTNTTAQIDNGDGTYTPVTKEYGTNINGADPVTNYVAEVNGKQYTSLQAAIAAANGGEVEILRDVSESLASIENVTFITNVAGGVTITNTATGSSWIAFENVTIGSGVTLISANVLTNGAYVNVIEGTLIAGLEGTTGGNFYQCNDAKTIIRNGGKVIVNGDVILRYNDEDDAGIFIYGDSDASTVEFSTTGYIGAYSGAFYAENAVISAGTDLRLDFYDLKNGVVKGEESDEYDPVVAEFVNTTVNVTGQLRLYKDAHLILNDAELHAGVLQVRAVALPVVSVDATSSLTADKVEVVTGALLDAIRDAEGNITFKPMVAQVGTKTYSSLQAAIDAAGAGGTVTLLVPYVVEAGETVVLDLKGATIVGTPTENAAYAVITNKGNLTITDSVGGGKILCDHKLAGSTAYAVNTIVNGGTLTIEGGIIENKSTASNQIGYAIDNNSTTSNAILIINGGEVKASGSNYYDGIRLFCNSLTAENSVTVNGGEVSTIWMQNPSDGASEKNTKDVKGSVVISGGKVGGLYLEPSTEFAGAITGGEIGIVSKFQAAENRDLTGFITGGTFNADVSEFLADGYKLTGNGDGTFDAVKKGTGKVAYRGYINNSESRQAVQIDLENVKAYESLVIKLYDANGNLLTTTTLKAGAAEANAFTCNIVLSGTPSGSWDTVIHAEKLTVANAPATIEVIVDGEVTDIYQNALGDKYGEYYELACVYKAAKIGGNYYATITEAINAAQNGDTIVLLPGTIDEVVNIAKLNKTITIKGADNFATTLTGGIVIGVDDNITDSGIITIEGINFVGKGVIVDELAEVYIKNNQFANTPASAIIVRCDNTTNKVVVEDNVINGTGDAGIRVRTPKELTITGNTIENTKTNGITVEYGSTHSKNNATITITDNTLKNWAYQNDEGRAIRIALGAGNVQKTVTVENNVMIHTAAPEQFVKITDNAGAEISVDKNYWSGKSPVDAGIMDVAGTYPTNYYSDAELKTLVEVLYVAQIGDVKYLTLQAAVDAADEGDEITLLANGGTAVVSKKLTIKQNGFTATVSATTGLTVVVEDSAYVIKEASAVITGEAAIGGTIYATLADAIEAAQDGSFINLLANIAQKPENVTINKNLVIIPNGYTLWEADATVALGQITDVANFSVTQNFGIIFISKLETGKTNVAQINGVYYTSIKAALEAAKPGDVITMIADSDESGSHLRINEGVILNLDKYTLKVASLTGGKNTAVTADTYSGDGVYGKLYADDLSLQEAPTTDAYDRRILPFWDKDLGCYVFAFFEFYDEGYNGGALKVDKENKIIKFMFKHRVGGTANTKYLTDGTSDNMMKIIVRASWKNGEDTYDMDFTYKDGFVSTVASSDDMWYTFTLTSYDLVGVELEDFTIQAMVITESGVVSTGTLFKGVDAVETTLERS